MTDADMIAEMKAAIDKELRDCVAALLEGYPAELIRMFSYQLGWEGEKAGNEAQGKRLRPMLVLLACHAFGGDWRDALLAAASVEFVHNFSLIHDDIQDRSETRRGRPTVWVKWGEAQAINTGDAMLTVAHLALLRSARKQEMAKVNRVVEVLQTACLQLTHGQHLDIAFEKQESVPLELYWKMVEGKTSSLLAACLELGALFGGADPIACLQMHEFGKKIGTAFQVQDDWLGIWGDAEILGKSTSSDLMTRKLTYPILLGIEKGGQFAATWKATPSIDVNAAKKLRTLLEQEGMQAATRTQFVRLYDEAFLIFEKVNLNQKRCEPLKLTVESLFGRIK